MADFKKISIKILFLAACLCVFCPGKALAADSPAGAEAGIIEVQSGFLDKKGNFREMKSGSGFLIANKTGDTYIITNCSNVSNTPRTIKKYCKKHSIDTQNTEFSNYIQIVIKGDVAAEAEVVVKSAEKDYCVLSAADVVSQKESLKLGGSADVEINDLVYAYGFPKITGAKADTAEYSEADVRAAQGAVIEKESQWENGVYLAHSAPVAQGCAGGPLLDADGYVIGLNCRQSPEDDTGTAYALPIDEIRAVLDNFSIYYGSRETDDAYAQLAAAYQACTDIYEAGGYKKASLEELQKALTAAAETMKEEEPAAEKLLEASQALTAAKNGLVPKMKPLEAAVRVLGVCTGLLFLWMVILAVKNAQEKKQDGKSENPPPPAAGGKLRLICQKTGQAVTVNKNRFIIGKSVKSADFSIADNQTVSRRHAVLFEKNGSWYIDDLESLNGTYVNGSRITAGQAVKLTNGDEIVLSDEVFLVQT